MEIDQTTWRVTFALALVGGLSIIIMAYAFAKGILLGAARALGIGKKRKQRGPSYADIGELADAICEKRAEIDPCMKRVFRSLAESLDDISEEIEGAEPDHDIFGLIYNLNRAADGHE